MSYEDEIKVEKLIKELTQEMTSQFRLGNFKESQDIYNKIVEIKDEELNNTKFIKNKHK
jgi:hypothetical protein